MCDKNICEVWNKHGIQTSELDKGPPLITDSQCGASRSLQSSLLPGTQQCWGVQKAQVPE